MYHNTEGVLTDVPVAIRSYYQEETRSEPTGNTIQEEYTSVDEEGNEVTLVRDVPEMEDVTYIVQIPFGETKSWSAVDSVIELGKDSYVVNKFIGLATNGEHKTFHDNYINWLEAEPSEPVRAHDEDGTFIPDDIETEVNEAYVDGYTPEMYAEKLQAWQESEPVINLTNVPTYYRKAAQADREQLENSNIAVEGMTFQVRTTDLDRMARTVNTANRNPDGPQTTPWILADNSRVEVDVATLELVQDAHTLRMGQLFTQYGEWCEGDMSQAIVWDI